MAPTYTPITGIGTVKGEYVYTKYGWVKRTPVPTPTPTTARQTYPQTRMPPRTTTAPQHTPIPKTLNRTPMPLRQTPIPINQTQMPQKQISESLRDYSGNLRQMLMPLTHSMSWTPGGDFLQSQGISGSLPGLNYPKLASSLPSGISTSNNLSGYNLALKTLNTPYRVAEPDAKLKSSSIFPGGSSRAFGTSSSWVDEMQSKLKPGGLWDSVTGQLNVKVKGNEDVDKAYEQLQGDYSKIYEKYASDRSGEESLAFLVDAIGNNAVNNQTLLDQIAALDIEPDEKMELMYEQQRKGIRDLYAELIEKKRSEIPGIRTKTDELITDLENALTKYEQLGGEKQAEAQDVYGQYMRQAAEMGRASQGQLRNRMAAMGASESSQYLDRSQGIDREVQDRIGDYTRDMQQKITEIDRLLQEKRDLTERERKALYEKRDELIREAEHSINVYAIEEQDKLNQITAQEAQQQLDFQNMLRQYAAQGLLQGHQQAASLTELMLAGQIETDYLNRQQANTGQYMPGIPDEINSIISNPQFHDSSGQLNAIGRSQLIKLYQEKPEWQDIIRDILEQR